MQCVGCLDLGDGLGLELEALSDGVVEVLGHRAVVLGQQLAARPVRVIRGLPDTLGAAPHIEHLTTSGYRRGDNNAQVSSTVVSRASKKSGKLALA